MSYGREYDDILDVCAYLQSCQKENLEGSAAAVCRVKKLRSEMAALTTTADETEQMAVALAAQLGISIDPMLPVLPRKPKEQRVLLVQNPPALEPYFDTLLKAAHAEGFIGTQPEHMLNASQMQRAQAFEAKLDADFARAVQLNGKEIALLCLGVGLHVLRHFLYCLGTDQAMLKNVDQPKADEEREPSFNASSGVNMDDLLKDALKKGPGAIGSVANIAPRKVKNYQAILEDTIPYILEDESNAHAKILGVHNILGWIFGVINILTDSVTFSTLQSFSIIRPMPQRAPTLDSPISTFSDILMPFMQMTKISRFDMQALAAAVLRQFYVLNPRPDGESLMKGNFSEAMESIERLDRIGRSSAIIGEIDIGKLLRQGGLAGIINVIISLLHNLQYDATRDGDKDMYAVRTRRIVTHASAISTLCNTVPAMLGVGKADVGGTIAAVAQLVSSTRFWIVAKANFLTSHYMAELQPEMDKMDQYFSP